ncbi:MAG: GNAT family N-acetyltransferase [Gemmatimonadaceae bacterium]|nr:GNAT family N-acetyltransferase [Gemmatimonadaceae bacterium]
MRHTHALTIDDLDQVRTLADASLREGFRFVQRFVDDMPTTALDTREQWFFGVFDDRVLRAIGGVTPDPYALDANVGRVRRVYVAVDVRRQGYGHLLLDALETRARDVYPILRLNTDTPAAAAFYEQRGYTRIVDESATHMRRIRVSEVGSS